MNTPSIVHRFFLCTLVAVCAALPAVAADRKNVKVSELPAFMKNGGVVFPEDRQRLSLLAKTIAAMRAGTVDPNVQATTTQMLDDAMVYVFPSQNVKQKAIAQAIDDYKSFHADLEKPEAKTPPLWFDLLQVGDIGRLRRPVPNYETPQADHAVLFRIVQIAGPAELVISSEHWSTKENGRAFVDTSTDGIVDDREHSFGNKLFECVGTKDTIYGLIFHLVERDPKTVLK